MNKKSKFQDYVLKWNFHLQDEEKIIPRLEFGVIPPKVPEMGNLITQEILEGRIKIP